MPHNALECGSDGARPERKFRRIFVQDGGHCLRAGVALERPLAIQHLASVALATGDARRAALLGGFVDARYAALGLIRDTSEQYTYERLRAGLQAALSADEVAQAVSEGAALSEDIAVAESALV